MTSFHVYLYGPRKGPIATSFEQAQQRLGELPRLYCEPDGSFVWTNPGGSEQVFGMLFDAKGQIQYCELRGTCSRASWRALVAAVTGHHFELASITTEDRDAVMAMVVLRLPEQILQDFQSFEESLSVV
jgi:hypothetical protein